MAKCFILPSKIIFKKIAIMKKVNSFILAVLAITIAFTACTEGTNESVIISDSAAVATMAGAADANQEKLEANKKIASDFVQALLGDKDSTAIDKYIADDIKEHNPLLQDGKQWLKDALMPFLSIPNAEKTKVNIDMMAAEGDMVWLLIKDVAPNDKVFARVTIFKILDGKIVEAWKVSEAVPSKSANDNTMF